ncbi:MAG: hypothetical protein GY765_20625 [bacterium]|nr:hypothetical protein [bacterium]
MITTKKGSWKRVFLRDVGILFLLCLGIMLPVSHGNNRLPPPALAGGAGFTGGTNNTFTSALSTPASLFAAPRPIGKVKRKKALFVTRAFKWVDPNKNKRETVFKISNAFLKTEMRKFGRPRSMTNTAFLEKKGFKIISRSNYVRNRKIQERVTTVVDYRQIFQRNLAYFPQLTETLLKSAVVAPREDPLRKFLSFVQQIPYKQPPQVYKGKYIGAFFVPLLCLHKQYGDCDSKSLLLADFLACTPGSKEKMGMVLVRGMGMSHALLGLKRRFLPGMTALFLQGKGYYIVIETTRSGWAPGFIDRRVTDAVKAGYFQFVELN